jgi:hypothetical protein
MISDATLGLQGLCFQFAPYSGDACVCTVQITASYLFEDSNNCPCCATNCGHGRRKQRIEPHVIKRVETDLKSATYLHFMKSNMYF